MNRWIHAARRRWRSILLHAMTVGSPRWRGVGSGLVMKIDPGDFMDRAFFAATYDPTFLAMMRAWVQRGDTCIDCGAQKGYFSLHLAKRVGKAGSVHAFEPDARAHALLKEHVQHNRLSHLKVWDVALGHEPGKLMLHLSSQLGWSTAFPNELAAPTLDRMVEVDVTSLDYLHASHCLEWTPGRLTWVKIDCEGSEALVLEGMSNTLRTESPLVWIEINQTSLKASGSSADHVGTLLYHLGYQLYLPGLRFTPWGEPRPFLRRLNTIGERVEPLFDIVALKPGAWPGREQRLRITDSIP